MITRVRSALRALVDRRQFEAGMADELQFHLNAYADELVRAGVEPDEARRQARKAFGSIDLVKRDCRETRGLGYADAVLQDVAYAFRLMRKSPALTATTVATIAVCLGTNLAAFAVLDGVLLRPLPFPDGDRLVRIFNTYPGAGVPDDGVSLTNYYERRNELAVFSSLAIFHERMAIVGETGTAGREAVTHVSPDFFETLDVGLAAGRAFTEHETVPGADRTVIVTDGYWRHVLGGNPAVVGHRIRIDGSERLIVGVLPPDFAFLSSRARLYVPLASEAERRGAGRRHWGSQADMIARLAPGVSTEQAQAAVDAHNSAVERGSRDAARMAEAGFRSLVVPLGADHVADVRRTLVLVQAGALVLLLIGAVNLANLLLIRAAGRVREFAIRHAVGASRSRMIGEVAVETLVLTCFGGVAGAALGFAAIELLTPFAVDRLPLGARIAFDARIGITAAMGSLLLGLLLAVPVAWYVLRMQGHGALHGGGRMTPGRGAERLRYAFVVAQLSLGFMLLAGAGLLALSLQRVTARQPGFEPQQVITARVSMHWSRYSDVEARLDFTQRLPSRLSTEPGVVTAGLVTNVPMSGNNTRSAATVQAEGRSDGAPPHAIYSYAVAGEYFGTMGIPLREGRVLTDADARPDARFCVVDEAFARRNFPDGRVLGRRLFMGGRAGAPDEAFTIVGVVGAVKQEALTEDGAQGAVYYPYPHRAETDIYVVVRTTLPLATLGGVLRHVIGSIDPWVAISDVRSMETRIDDTLIVRRAPALLGGILAAVALLLTAIGTYGVLGHAVTLRRREIALRMALGARPAQVRTHFVRLGARLLAAGLAVGLAGAGASGRAMQALLFDVPPLHAPTLLAAGLVVTGVALAAILAPSVSAARTSPAEILSAE